jgi:molybdenum cofactor cytidylyltransferase
MRAAILLAAGSSRRFGRGDKLLARLGGRPVLFHALDRAVESGATRVIVVIPSHGGRIGRSIRRGGGIVPVVARRHRDGLAESLKAGLHALRPIEREILIFLGDMPFAAAPRGMRLRAGQDAVRPVYRGEPGHPLLVRTAVARSIRLNGDQGLAGKLASVGRIGGGVGNLIDIDTPAALRRARFSQRHNRAVHSSCP